MIAASVVDFPAPFGPTIATISPSATSNEIEWSAVHAPVARGEAVNRQHRPALRRRRLAPRYASITRGSLRTSAGLPSAIVRP